MRVLRPALGTALGGDGVTRNDLKLILAFLLDFIITSGTTIGGAMLETGTAAMPHQAVILLALIMGVVIAARKAQASLSPAAQETTEQTVKQLVAQMRTVQLVAAQSLPAPEPTPVTPKRVDLSLIHI